MKQVKITESSVAEAMAQIDTLDGISSKEKNNLRLLTEEMFSMCKELLNVEQLDFAVSSEDKIYTLRSEVKTHVNEDAREEFLSMSSSGKNVANKGFKGVLGSIVDIFTNEDSLEGCNHALIGGMCLPGGNDYLYMWSLSRYEATLKEDQNPWDGMEKSIIANFADDISIGVRSGRLEIIVTKSF